MPIRDVCHSKLYAWLESCRRAGKLSRNTLAIGIVVLDHLRKKSPVSSSEVLSKGGEVTGARSGLLKVLEKYGLPRSFLKEVTTRQGHQDGQRLFHAFDWGNELLELSPEEKEVLLIELIGVLLIHAQSWLQKQNLKLEIDRRHSPATWINVIVESAKNRSGGIVEQHLIGAKLERRFPDTKIPNFPAHAGDQQTEREGDFSISKLVFHVTAAPSRNVIQKCIRNMKSEKTPILVVPREQEYKTRVLAQDEGVGKEITVLSIEDFVAGNIVEISTSEKKELFSVLKEIINIYNRRLNEVETNLSLKIEVR